VNKPKSVLDKVLRLLHAELDAVLLNLLVVVLDRFKAAKDLFGNLSLRELKHLVETIITKDRHDTRDNKARNTGLATVVHPLIKNLIFKEQLSDNEVSACINFLLQELDVVLAWRGLQMDLWVSSNSDTEVVAVLLLDEANQVNCVIESVLIVDPVSSTSWWVTPQRQNISNSELLCLVQAFNNLFACHKWASHMHHDVKAAVSLYVTAEIKSDVGSSTASTPSHIDPQRVSLSHSLDTIEQVLNTLRCPGWEILIRVKVLLLVRLRKSALNFFVKFHAK
jgi:hypothetical protein